VKIKQQILDYNPQLENIISIFLGRILVLNELDVNQVSLMFLF